LTKLVHYQCPQCSTVFEGYPGPIDCINCGFKYVRNLDATDIYEDVKAPKKEVAETEDDERQVDDDCMDCHHGCFAG
jgi:uncharacterized Zn finger protein (UPF0148 family)